MQALLLALVSFLVFLLFPSQISAQESTPSLPTITVINPLRGHQLGLENADLLASLKSQWGLTRQQDISATWLWQYSALEEKDMVTFAKKNMLKQEFGIFLEVDKNLAEKSGIQYKGKGPWYHSDGLLLISYDKYERRKLIDTVFEKFKNEFGYYPTTAGAWWVGADAINYLHDKYHVSAVLQCADQFNTDAYSLWGTPWSIPYIPSKENAAIPAQRMVDKQNNVVVLQWASRDPLRGYGSSGKESMYSVQDMKFPELDYYEYLSNIYLQKPYDQTVIGLEGGLPPDSYTIYYSRELQKLKTWEREKKITIQTASDYAKAFLKRGKIFPPTSSFLTKDFKNNNQSFWYHSPHYRVAIQKIREEIYLIDFRDYQQTLSEDFLVLPNTQSLIRINTKAPIDAIRFPEQKRFLATSTNPLQVETVNNRTTLTSGNKILATFSEESFALPTLHNDYRFSPQYHLPYSALFVFSIIISYLTYLAWKTKKRTILFISAGCFLLSVLSIQPIFTNGALYSDTYFFADQFLPLLSFVSLMPIDPQLKIFFVYQFLPLVMIVIFHFFITKKINEPTLLFAIYVTFSIMLMLIFTNIWPHIFELFGQGKKAKLIGIGLLFFVSSGILVLINLYKQRKIKLFLIIISTVFLLLFFITCQQLFKQKSLIITPFEMEALEEIYRQQRDVLYLSAPQTTAIELYKSVHPILFTNNGLGDALTKTNWEEIKQNEKNEYSLQAVKQKLIVIPRYQGADISDEEIKRYKLNKIFDNAQIAIDRHK